MTDLKKEDTLWKTLTDYRASLPSTFVNYNKITEEDLKQLKNVKKQKIVFTQPFGKFQVGDILEVKFISNYQQSEPPSFLVIDEELGSSKYGFGGRGSTPFYKLYKEKENTLAPPTKSDSPFISKSLGAYNKNLIIAVVLVAGYFAYKKFKK